jgi:hypothetical protein
MGANKKRYRNIRKNQKVYRSYFTAQAELQIKERRK